MMADYLDLDTQDDADFVVDDLVPTFSLGDEDDQENDSEDEVRSETSRIRRKRALRNRKSGGGNATLAMSPETTYGPGIESQLTQHAGESSPSDGTWDVIGDNVNDLSVVYVPGPPKRGSDWYWNIPAYNRDDPPSGIASFIESDNFVPLLHHDNVRFLKSQTESGCHELNVGIASAEGGGFEPSSAFFPGVVSGLANLSEAVKGNYNKEGEGDFCLAVNLSPDTAESAIAFLKKRLPDSHRKEKTIMGFIKDNQIIPKLRNTHDSLRGTEAHEAMDVAFPYLYDASTYSLKTGVEPDRCGADRFVKGTRVIVEVAIMAWAFKTSLKAYLRAVYFVGEGSSVTSSMTTVRKKKRLL